MKTIDKLTYLGFVPHQGTLEKHSSFKLNPYTIKVLIDVK